MWEFKSKELDGERAVKFALFEGSARVSYKQVIDAWVNDDTFRGRFVEVLRESSFEAFRWETPAVTDATIDRDFEFVLLDCPMLIRPVDRRAFAAYFDPSSSVVAFENLGRDAMMVVPCPDDSVIDCFCDLASFLRSASAEQAGELWRQTGLAMQERVGHEPVWLSTAGMGVAWLHIRLDSRPKYYGYAPYRNNLPTEPEF